MSANNNLTLFGNVGGEQSIRTLENDEGKVSVLSFSLAVNEWRYNPETKQNEAMTDWHTIKAFGFVANRLARFVQPGQKLLLLGRLNKETYEKDGETRTTYNMQVEDFTLISGGRDNGSSDESSEPVAELEDGEFPF